MSQPFETDEAVYLDRNTWITALCVAPFLIGMLGVVVSLISHTPALADLMPYLTMGGLVGLFYAWAKNPGAHRLKASVRAGNKGLQIDCASKLPFLPREQIREGFVFSPPSGPPRVRLVLRSLQPPVELEVRSEAEGRGLLRALGLDVSQAVASFRVLSQLMARPRLNRSVRLGLFISLGSLTSAGALLHLPLFLMPLLPLIFGLFLLVALMPSWLDVGADGVMITWFWQKRFIAYGDIDGVTAFERDLRSTGVRGLLLTLRSGEQIWVPVGRRSWDNASVAIIHERIREAMESHKQGGTEALAALLRHGRSSVKAWITALRSIGAGANADHRIAPVAPERLWRVVEDPSARAIGRAAAAVALGAGIDDEGRARLRAAAGATAAPKLRIALQAAALEADDAQIEQALRELEATEPDAEPLKTYQREGPELERSGNLSEGS